MKKYLFILSTLAATTLASCSSNSGPDKFLGKWQSIKVPTRPILSIEKKGDILVVGDKKHEFPATYDKEGKKVIFNVPLAGTIDIVYLADTDHILVTEDGEYARVKE
ncbi:MAG: hypothetical protein ACRYFX_09740 [Janthinobacterium lividum]